MGADEAPLVVVGPCAAGKSTLVAGLLKVGIPARSVAQEHSRVRDLFTRQPAAGVIYLTATWPVIHARRPLSLGRVQYEEEVRRLQYVRSCADLVVHTDSLSPEGVLEIVRGWFRDRRMGSRPGASARPD